MYIIIYNIFEYYNYNLNYGDNINTKLNSNQYHYKLKFILTSKQKYNSKFQELESVQTLKIQKKRPYLNQKNFLGSTVMRKINIIL